MENKLETIKNSLNTLVYILESNVNKNIIEEIELGKVSYYERFNTFEGIIRIKTFCEDPDVGSFNSIVNKVDDELYNTIKEYHFNSNGTLKKRQGSDDNYLMTLFIGCKWENMGDNGLYMTYHLMQDEFNDTEE
jgi:hypothetical protein